MLGTTKAFLEIFSLENLSSLPAIKEVEDLDNSQLPSILRDRMIQNVTSDENALNAEIDIEKSTAGQVATENVFHTEEQASASLITELVEHTEGEYTTSNESSEEES